MRDRNDDQVNGVAAAIEAGRQLGTVEGRVESVISHDDEASIPYVLRDSCQEVASLAALQAAADRLAARPRRRTGTATHHEQQSFVDHINRFKGPNSSVWADATEVKLTAILNYHRSGQDGDPEWCDHRAVYTCPLSDEWKAWTARDGKFFRQEEFADFIEEHSPEINDRAEGMPKALDLMELATNLRLYTKGTNVKQFDRRTGAYELVNKTEVAEQSTPIPKAFGILIPVFVGGDLFAVECRMRITTRDGQILLGYEMHRRAEHLRTAFSDVREKVKAETALPVFAGSPEEAP